MELSKVSVREKLKVQREPHWHKLDRGSYLGFRRSKKGDGGAWIARYYDPDTLKKHYHALGTYGTLPPNEQFGAAKKAATEWLEHVGGGGSHKPMTVLEACERYAGLSVNASPEAIREAPAGKADVHRRFHQYVYADPVAKVPLNKLTRRQVEGWRDRLAKLPAVVSRSKSGPVVTRSRSDSSLNRDMTPFRAALNLALEHGDALTSQAWKAALKPVEAADGKRNLYLDKDQRRALLDRLPEDLAAFARALCLLPLRPGALAGLKAGSFDQRRSELAIGVDKAGGGRKILLPAETVTLFRDQSRDKLPAAWLFTRADGAPWTKDAWKHGIKAAVRAAGLPADATIYTLRHSTITDLVIGGLDLLTVAQVSGTSVRMIENHYGHLQRKHAAEALAALRL